MTRDTVFEFINASESVKPVVALNLESSPLKKKNNKNEKNKLKTQGNSRCNFLQLSLFLSPSFSENYFLSSFVLSLVNSWSVFMRMRMEKNIDKNTEINSNTFF